MWRYDAVTLSGGVGACCANRRPIRSGSGDLGPSLARAIVRHPGFASLLLLPPLPDGAGYGDRCRLMDAFAFRRDGLG